MQGAQALHKLAGHGGPASAKVNAPCWCSLTASGWMGRGLWAPGGQTVSAATWDSPWDSCDPAGTAWIQAECSARVQDALLHPLDVQWFVLAGAGQAEQGLGTHCLLLCPADTFTITNPSPQGTGGMGRGSALVFCWFYFPLKVVIHSSSLTHSSLPRRSFLGAAWTIPKQCRSHWQGKSNWKLVPKQVLYFFRGRGW